MANVTEPIEGQSFRGNSETQTDQKGIISNREMEGKLTSCAICKGT